MTSATQKGMTPLAAPSKEQVPDTDADSVSRWLRQGTLAGWYVNPRRCMDRPPPSLLTMVPQTRSLTCDAEIPSQPNEMRCRI